MHTENHYINKSYYSTTFDLILHTILGITLDIILYKCYTTSLFCIINHKNQRSVAASVEI